VLKSRAKQKKKLGMLCNVINFRRRKRLNEAHNLEKGFGYIYNFELSIMQNRSMLKKFLCHYIKKMYLFFHGRLCSTTREEIVESSLFD
jgi:hypothetical protein